MSGSNNDDKKKRRRKRKKKDKTLSDSSSNEENDGDHSSIDIDEERSIDVKQKSKSCFKSCAIMLKCCRGVAKIPCCATKFLIGSTCLMVLIALILAIVYGVDVANMYQRAGDYVWPLLKKIPIPPV